MKDIRSRVGNLHENNLVAVIHDHRPIGPDLPLMKAGGVTAKVYQIALDVDPQLGCEASRARNDGWLELARDGMKEARREIESNRTRCTLALTAGDILEAKKQKMIAILFGAEGARWLEGRLEPLEEFYRMGLREMQLAWAFPNQLVPDGRLSPFGVEVVKACEQLGIVIDLTHVPARTFYDAMEAANGPVIVSHGAAKGVTCDLDDARIRALAEKGGLLGIHFFSTYLGPGPSPDAVVRQIDYVAELVGIDHIGLGVDFFPTEGVWRDLQLAQGTTDLSWAVKDLSEIPQITECLLNHGYSESDIAKVLGGNFLRLCYEVFGS